MDLSTRYLGLKLRCPIVPSASPLSRSVDRIKKMEDAGAGAVVLSSLFEEQVRQEQAELVHFLENGTESFAEAQSYFPDLGSYKVGPELYLENVRKAKQATNIPIIGSINGVTVGGWIDYAKKIEQAGADALELNVYWIPTDPKLDAAAVEKVYVEILKAVKAAVRIPVAMKLSPYFSALTHTALEFEKAGANGLVLFNRFYQPDIDLETLKVVSEAALSNSTDARLPMRWIAILRKYLGPTSLAATGGVHSADDAIKLLMVGADCVQVCATLLQHGIGRITEIRDHLAQWMEKHEYSSVEQMKGSLSQRTCPEPAAFERAHYLKALDGYSL